LTGNAMMAGKTKAPCRPPACLRVCLGVITKAHGLRGEVRIRSYTEDPRAVAAYGPVTDEAGSRSMTVKILGPLNGGVTARIEGIKDRTGAEALKGTRLYVPRSALPDPRDEEFYHCDLIGLRAELVSGGELGTVSAVHNYGAGDVIEIARPGRKAPVLLPFTRTTVPVIDMAAGRIKVDLPEGVLGTRDDDEMDVPVAASGEVKTARRAKGEKTKGEKS
jgi:16S rRNA processing protein RimM